MCQTLTLDVQSLTPECHFLNMVGLSESNKLYELFLLERS